MNPLLLMFRSGRNEVAVSSSTPLPVVSTIDQPATRSLQETTITAGGTAQDLFSSATPGTGYEIINPDQSEILWFREAATAAVAGATSTPIAPGGSYITPPTYKPTGRVSVIAATTAHAVIARSF